MALYLTHYRFLGQVDRPDVLIRMSDAPTHREKGVRRVPVSVRFPGGFWFRISSGSLYLDDVPGELPYRFLAKLGNNTPVVILTG
jgi:hypothetical protein